MLKSCRAGAATDDKANEPMSIAVEIQLNKQQQAALERVARRRKVSLPRALKSAVDDFIERLEEGDPIWSPHAAFEAAAVLQDMLEQEQRGQHG